MSSQQLLFDKLDGDVCRSRTLPSTYAKPRELRRLKSLLRRAGRVLQSGPDIQNPLNLGSQLAQSLGIFRNPLKTSLLSAADVKANPYAIWLMGPARGSINRLGGNFRWQHLPVPFEVYADGIDLVVFEEFGAGAAALHLRDELERNELLRDESYRREFRKDYESKFGLRVWHRDFFDAEIVDCPDASVVGKSFGEVGRDRGGLHPVDAFLDLVLEHGRALRWRTTISNHRPEVLKKLARDPGIQMGFSDAGAHLRNMAFYNMGLRLLRHVRDAEQAGKPFMTVEQAVHRLTGELADWYRLDAGHLRIGDRADVVVIDPRRLDESARRLRRGAPSSSTAACPGWSTATTTPSMPCSSAAARFSSTAQPPISSANSAPVGSCVPRTRSQRSRRRTVSWQVSVEDTVLSMWRALSAPGSMGFVRQTSLRLTMSSGPRAAAAGPTGTSR